MFTISYQYSTATMDSTVHQATLALKKMTFHSNYKTSSADVSKINAVLKDYIMSDEKLETVTERLLQEMNKGLSKATHNDAKVKMFPSYVTAAPDGKEDGLFLALDLGGTNFRVLLVTLRPGQKPEMESQIYKMSTDIMTGPGEKLFDHIASCMAEFLERIDIKDKVLPVGFTFSFPCRQDGLDKATLMAWTKGFSAPGVEGKEIVSLLREAIDRRGDLKVSIVAVVNDTVGTLMSCAYDVKDCVAGLIVGTGCNCCYMEKAKNVELIPETEGDMCVNMEWGAFGDDGALDDIRTDIDREIDENSPNKGRQLYEKLISGMYLGEVVRRIIVKLAEEGVIFSGHMSEALRTPGNFDTAFVSQIETNSPNGLNHLQSILCQLDIGAMHSDCEIVQYVCRVVSTRAAYLCAAGIAAVARKIRQNYPAKKDMEITVGVDGSVYKKHPTFALNTAEKVDQLNSGLGIQVKFALSHDGSGKGAALIAAVADKPQMNGH